MIILQTIEEIKEMYNQGMSLQNIANTVGYKSAHSIRSKLLSVGVTMRTKAGNRNMGINDRYFSVLDTEKKAYFAGFLLADGSVNIREKSKPQIRIEILTTDSYILNEMRTDIKIENTVKVTSKGCSALRWHSQTMFDDLAKYSVVPNKTNNKRLTMNTIPEDMIKHFIRGFFDGNGYASRKGNRRIVGFCDGYDFLVELKTYLAEKLSISNNNVYTSTSSGSRFIEYGNQEDVQKLISYMYDDATIYLTRKYDKLYANIEVGAKEASSVTHR
jgi:intein-encoded DNA endonuclease-like protein